MQLLFILIPAKLLALAVGIYYLRNLSTAYILLLIQVLFATSGELLGYYLGTIKHQNNIWVFYYLLLIDCWLIGISGRYFLADGMLKKSVPILLSAISCIWLADLFKTGLNTFSNKFFICYSVLLIVIYITVLTRPAFTEKNILKYPVVWVCIATILYYGCMIPYIGLLNYLLKNAPNTADRLYDIILGLNFIRYPLVALAFYLCGRQQQMALKAT
jgi:hypothetical protein